MRLIAAYSGSGSLQKIGMYHLRSKSGYTMYDDEIILKERLTPLLGTLK